MQHLQRLFVAGNMKGLVAQMPPLDASDIAAFTKAAHATNDPSIFHNWLQNFAQSKLDPMQKNFFIWQGQMVERAMSLRNIAGMGQASDSLRAAIINTLPTAFDTP